MELTDLTCDRCHKQIDGWIDSHGSAGCYDCSGTPWPSFCDPGEQVICDDCMWSDPRYIAVYGDNRPGKSLLES